MEVWDLRRLLLLRELADRGRLSDVAAALSYSPSAVSQQLAVLEKESGTALLEPSGRGVRLTAAGELLVEHARHLLASGDAARADLARLMASDGELRGRMRFGTLQSAAQRLIIPVVQRLQGEHPLLRFELREHEFEAAIPELRLGGLDVVISDEYDGQARPRPEGTATTVLLEEPLLVLLPSRHRLARPAKPVALADLAAEPWVASARGTGHHAAVLAHCRALGGFDPDLRHLTNDAMTQIEAVRSLGAVGLLPRLALPTRTSGVAARPIAEGSVRRRLFAVTRVGPRPPALDLVLRELSAQAAARQ
ncbi:MAG TPA: LysR family transcriptional regulator [Intrasporangiaceae bacterium]|nr:LysR family transcriptional regulator [Intrasporangiaceae bacterium]